MRNKDKMQYALAFLAALLYICTTQVAGYPEVRRYIAPESSSIELQEHNVPNPKGTYLSYEQRAAQDDSGIPYGFYDWSLYNSSWAAEMQQRINKIREEE